MNLGAFTDAVTLICSEPTFDANIRSQGCMDKQLLVRQLTAYFAASLHI
jgi:hypothetical protein